MPQPKFGENQKVRIVTPLAKIKWGHIQKCWIGQFKNLTTIQKFQYPTEIFCYWVKCGPQGFIHGYYEHELEAIHEEKY